jgi:peptide/nickel transport system substrate-binding protein
MSLLAAFTVLDATAASAATKNRSTSSSGAVVTLAEGAQGTPNFIMPFVTGANNAEANLNLQYQMWPTLYTISTPKSVNAINTTLSLADPPVYKDGNTQVSITLKPWKWSDGAPLTARDVTFFMNILKADKTSWSSWAPGNMPTNVVSWTAQGTSTVVFKLNKAYNPTWFTDTELAHIVPMPQQAWDKESATGAVGTYDTTTAGAKAVYTFLKKQGQDTATYNTNPLWQVVDGAWKIKQYTSNSFVALVPNTAYSGPDKPHIAKFEEIPYTSSTAEFNALLSGGVSLGYVPLNDVTETSRVQGVGYRTVRSALEAANMLSLNYHSPVVGPLVKQLYIREALNDVMDQPAQIKAILHGNAGYPDYGPIPPEPPNPYMAPLQKKSPFDIAAARKLLTSHGWKIPANGAATCTKPGTGSSECGAGIPKGKKLTFALVYDSGSGYLTATMANYKSDASQVGIVINLNQQPFNSIVGDICGTPTCDSPGWQIANWGAGFAENYNSPYPEGAPIFENHVGLDYPVTKTFASLMDATKVATGSKTVKAMKAYDTWVIQHQLEVWQIETYTVNAVSSKVKNVWYSPITGNVYPQDFVVK